MTDTTNTWDLSGMHDALPSEAAALLREMGVTKAEFTGLFSVRFADVSETIFGVFRGNLREPSLFLATGLGVLLLLGVFGTVGKDGGREERIRDYIGGLFFITACASPLYAALTVAVSAVKSCGALMIALVPILAAVVAASGSPVLSAVWQTAVFSAAQTVSAAASGFMAPCCGLIAGTGVLSALVPQVPLSDLPVKIRKCCTWIFSAMATLFTAFLSLKGLLAGSADSLTAKGIKLAVSSFIPVIGTQLGEAYASVVGSLAAVRSTAGVFAILAVCAVALPAGVQLLLWMASLKLLGIAAGLLGRKNAAALLSAFDSALSVLHACLLFVTVLYVLSVGVILKVRAGV